MLTDKLRVKEELRVILGLWPDHLEGWRQHQLRWEHREKAGFEGRRGSQFWRQSVSEAY